MSLPAHSRPHPSLFGKDGKRCPKYKRQDQKYPVWTRKHVHQDQQSGPKLAVETLSVLEEKGIHHFSVDVRSFDFKPTSAAFLDSNLAKALKRPRFLLLYLDCQHKRVKRKYLEAIIKCGRVATSPVRNLSYLLKSSRKNSKDSLSTGSCKFEDACSASILVRFVLTIRRVVK